MMSINFLLFLKPYVLAMLLFSNGCGSQPGGSSAIGNLGNEDANQNLKCASKVVPNTLPVPEFKVVRPTKGTVQLGKKVNWNVSDDVLEKYKATFQSLEKTALEYGAENADPIAIELKVLSEESIGKVQKGLPSDFTNKKDAYLLQVHEAKISLYAVDVAGLINGISSLEFLIMKANGSIPNGTILDWPDLETRAVQLVIRAITPEVAFAAIDRMRRGHYNTLLLSISNNVQFSAISKLANNCAWSVKDFLALVKYARESGMEVVPELRFLSHQHKDFLVPGAYPELMYNEKTYDPRKDEVYKIVFAYIDEVIKLMNPKAIHIGHDEVYGISGKSSGARDALPAALFKQDVLKIYNYLKSKNVRTWMWGDMLITPSELPDMHPGSINGSKEYAAIRNDLPKDILICDWHYREDPRKDLSQLQFPSVKLFADEGFEVIGATFRHPQVTKAFASYTASLDDPKVKGMMATTWSFVRRGSQNNRQSDDWKAFDEVLQYSAEAFWNAEK